MAERVYLAETRGLSTLVSIVPVGRYGEPRIHPDSAEEASRIDIQHDLRDARGLIEEADNHADGKKYRKAAEIVLLKILHADPSNEEARALLQRARNLAEERPAPQNDQPEPEQFASLEPEQFAPPEESAPPAQRTNVRITNMHNMNMHNANMHNTNVCSTNTCSLQRKFRSLRFR